jgi:high-affinity iron transporter
VVIFVAVLREGVEAILFVYGMIAAGRLSTLDVTAGIGLGILYGVAVAGALYLGLGAIPLRHVFKVISVLITLLAAGLAAQAVGLLQSAGHLSLWSEPVWDTSHILQQSRLPGRILHTLVGYLQQPTGLQIAAYALTIVAIVVAMRSRGGRAAAAGPLPRAPAARQ